MAETLTKIRRFQLDATDWTPILAPCACNWWEIVNCDSQNAILRSSDPSNSQAWLLIPAANSYALLAPLSSSRRYEQGDTVTYLKASSGTPTACVEFIP